MRLARPFLVMPLLALSLSAAAEPSAPGGDRPDRRGPPPEAIEACADAAESDVCEVVTREGDILDGSCLGPPHGGEGPLACVPDDRRPPPPRR
ncbi:MAG: hypothetical protein ACI8PZ_000920 [Myxococcota bacterium]|jgi:hypothetical protein